MISRSLEDLEVLGLVRKTDKSASLSPLAVQLLDGSKFAFPQSVICMDGKREAI
jgi:hypothetical protein